MGCNCCRMIKRPFCHSLTLTSVSSSYIYDPSSPVDINGHKRDPAGSSLYQPNCHLPGDHDAFQKKQGFYNLGYSSSGGIGGSSPPNSAGNPKLDVENNHINRLHGNGAPADDANSAWRGGGKGGGRGGGADSGIGIPQLKEQAALKNAPPLPSVPPIYQLPSAGKGLAGWDRERPRSGDDAVIRAGPYHLRDGLGGVECCVDDNDDEDERESGVGSTPEYLGDTGDEASVLSGDINTSSTSLSSAETRLGAGEDKRGRREVGGGEDREDCQSVTDSMVNEALAALEAATAGEDYD